MLRTHTCPKCGSKNVLRIPDNPLRYASSNSIYTSTVTLLGKVPVIRHVCADCGYVENWVEKSSQLENLRRAFQ